MRDKKSRGVCRAVGSGKIYKYSVIAKESGAYSPSFLLSELPDILDQGTVQSCVAHAIAESLYVQSGTDVSVLGIYGLWRRHKSEGMYTETALDMGRSVGTAKRSVAPGNYEVPEAIKKAKAYLAEKPEEFRFKVGSYYKIDKEVNEEGEFSVSYELIKNALTTYNVPLLVLTEGGSHAEICIGWADKGARSPVDDRLCVSEDSLIIQNSWGYIPYPRREEKITSIEEAYLILMDEVKTPFTDVKGHWAEKYIKNAYHAGYLKGRTETEFEPEGTLTRGEAAKLISELIVTYDEKIAKLEELLKEAKG